MGAVRIDRGETAGDVERDRAAEDAVAPDRERRAGAARRVVVTDPVVLSRFVAEVDVADAGQLRFDRPVFGEVTWEALIGDLLVLRAVRVEAEGAVAEAWAGGCR
jgi:hypothetical protein